MKLSAALRRHPVVTALATLFVLVLTIGGGLFGAARAVPSYQSEGIVLIIPPGAGSQVATNNPFVNLDQNVAQLAQALSTRMAAPDIVSGLQSRAPSLTGYTAAVRYDNAVVNSMPTSQLQFTVTGTDAQTVRDAVQQLMVIASDQLKQMQVHAGVKDDTLAQSVQLVAPTEPTAMAVSGARGAGMWAISGLLGSLVVLAVIGAVWRFYSRRDGDPETPAAHAASPASATTSADPVTRKTASSGGSRDSDTATLTSSTPAVTAPVVSEGDAQSAATSVKTATRPGQARPSSHPGGSANHSKRPNRR